MWHSTFFILFMGDFFVLFFVEEPNMCPDAILFELEEDTNNVSPGIDSNVDTLLHFLDLLLSTKSYENGHNDVVSLCLKRSNNTRSISLSGLFLMMHICNVLLGYMICQVSFVI